MIQAIGSPTEKIIIPEITAAARHPHRPIIQPTNGTSGPEMPGPMRKMPKAKLRRSRNSFAIKTLMGML